MRSTGRVMVCIISAMMFVVFLVSSVWAAPVLSGYQVMESKSTDYNLKSWTVKFSSPVAGSQISNYLRITDDNNQNISTHVTLSDDKTEVTLTPLLPYTWGQEYRVYVDGNLQSASEVFLRQAVVMSFVANQPYNYIANITHQRSTFITSFNITCTTGVYSVKVNETSARYQGENKYECNMAGVSAGTIVDVKAYDSQGSLLETRQYVVD